MKVLLRQRNAGFFDGGQRLVELVLFYKRSFRMFEPKQVK